MSNRGEKIEISKNILFKYGNWIEHFGFNICTTERYRNGITTKYIKFSDIPFSCCDLKS